MICSRVAWTLDALPARNDASSTAAGASVARPQSRSTTPRGCRATLTSHRSPWMRVDPFSRSWLARSSGWSNTANTSAATSGGAISAKYSQPRATRAPNGSSPPAAAMTRGDDSVAEVAHDGDDGAVAGVPSVDDGVTHAGRKLAEDAAGPQPQLTAGIAGGGSGKVGSGRGGLHDQLGAVVEDDSFQDGTGTAIVAIKRLAPDRTVEDRVGHGAHRHAMGASAACRAMAGPSQMPVQYVVSSAM